MLGKGRQLCTLCDVSRECVLLVEFVKTVSSFFPRAKVESRNNLETYLYNLKTSCEDTLKDKITAEDLEELRSAINAGLEVWYIVHEVGKG